jgi:glycopeptide antibiotics resistance protein
MQLFNFRSTDLDDLICNTLGALAGYVFFRLFTQRKHLTSVENSKPGPALLCLLVLLLNFFLFP